MVGDVIWAVAASLPSDLFICGGEAGEIHFIDPNEQDESRAIVFTYVASSLFYGIQPDSKDLHHPNTMQPKTGTTPTMRPSAPSPQYALVTTPRPPPTASSASTRRAP